MTTPPGQGEIPPLTAKDLDHLEGEPGRPQASRYRSVTFHWSAAEWGSLIAIARLGLEAQRWKAAAELATAGERGRAQELAAALGYAPGSIDWQRGLDLVRETITQRNAARAELARIPLNWMEIATVREADLKQAAQTVEGLRAQLAESERQLAKLKLDLEMARDDREQAEQDAEAGATMIARSERRQAELQQWRSTGTEWRRQLAGALGVDLGTTESPIAPPSMADLLLDVRQIVVKAGQIDSDAARVLKLETMIADAARQLSSAVGDGRPCSLTEAVDRVLHVLDKICANLGQRQDGETIQAQAGRVAVELAEAESQLANERAAALEQAKVKGRREADVERAALVAKLQLVREALGATLQPDGTDDVVDKARASASRGVPEILDRELEWYAVVDAIASRLGIACPGIPEVARETVWAAIAKLQDDLKPGLITAAILDPDPGRFAAELAAQLEEREARIASGLSPVPGIPSRRPLTLAAEQILRDVIEAANASGFTKLCDVFEVRHRPADAETPPRTELHVFAGKGPTTATKQVLAYVELGQLWIIALDGVAGYTMVQHLANYLRWPERIRAALDRK